ncbi:MAG: small basic protein [Candidatus Omnitrophota bacterium]
MSQHPSLHGEGKDRQHRSVLKRYERIKILKEKEDWKDKDSVFGLQKVKVVKFKIKKEKAAAAETEGAEGTAAPAAGAAKTAAPAKGAVAKDTGKAGTGEKK